MIVINEEFSEEEVKKEVESSNFNKTIRNDWFCGKSLRENPKVKMLMISIICSWLNKKTDLSMSKTAGDDPIQDEREEEC